MEGAGEIDNAGGNPDEFVSTVTSCCTQLMSHLHNLSQEALDHADLQVSTKAVSQLIRAEPLNIKYVTFTVQNWVGNEVYCVIVIIILTGIDVDSWSSSPCGKRSMDLQSFEETTGRVSYRLIGIPHQHFQQLKSMT